MGIRFYKATTPGLRERVSSDFQMVTQSEPEHSLTTGYHRKKGRNNVGRITSRHRGGGHKRNVRVGQ